MLAGSQPNLIFMAPFMYQVASVKSHHANQPSALLALPLAFAHWIAVQASMYPRKQSWLGLFEQFAGCR